MQEACLRHLAASVRAAHKIHGFAGGFDAELSALFDKVRPLPQLLLSVSCEIKRHCRGTLQGRLACATFTCVMGLPDWTELSTAHGNCIGFASSWTSASLQDAGGASVCKSCRCTCARR